MVPQNTQAGNLFGMPMYQRLGLIPSVADLSKACTSGLIHTCTYTGSLWPPPNPPLGPRTLAPQVYHIRVNLQRARDTCISLISRSSNSRSSSASSSSSGIVAVAIDMILEVIKRRTEIYVTVAVVNNGGTQLLKIRNMCLYNAASQCGLYSTTFLKN